jgi:hypothetical protein
VPKVVEVQTGATDRGDRRRPVNELVEVAAPQQPTGRAVNTNASGASSTYRARCSHIAETTGGGRLTTRRLARDFGGPMVSPTPRCSVTAWRTRTGPRRMSMSWRCSAVTWPQRRHPNVVTRTSAGTAPARRPERADLGDGQHRTLGRLLLVGTLGPARIAPNDLVFVHCGH